MAVSVLRDTCIGCGICYRTCPSGAIKRVDGKPEIKPDKCIDCKVCIESCPVSAIY